MCRFCIVGLPTGIGIAVVSSSLMLDEDIPGSLLHWDAEKIKRFMDKVDQCIKQ